MPGSRLETFEDAGHFPHHADPARFLAVLDDFLATTSPASYSAEQWRELLRRGRPTEAPGPVRERMEHTLASRRRSGT
jgi:hypothetical protein